MMTREMMERLAIVFLFLCFLLVGLIAGGKIKAEGYNPTYLPVPKETQYIIMTKEEYDELERKKCK